LQDAAISYTSASLRYDDGLISGQQISIPLGAVLNCGGGINMLPNEIKRQTRDYLLGAGARFVSILGSFIFLFVYLNFGFNIEGYKERLAAANSEAESLKLLVKEIEPLENLQEAVSNRLNLLQSLLGRRKVWSLILRELGRLLPEDITLDSLTVSETAVTIKGVVSSAKQPPENILSVFITSLEKGIFRDVALISTQKNEEQRTLDFSLSSKLDY